jgi:acetyl esterase/lipase
MVFIARLAAAAADTPQPTTHTYHRIPDIPVERTSLDVYPAGTQSNRPVVIFVHGGGWRRGDKGNVQRAHEFREFFRQMEMVLVSINYRLIGHEQSPTATYREQAADIAAAVRWAHQNIARYGGNPDVIFLLGYSAGAHLVALVGTDERYLEQEGLSFASLKGVVSLDVNAFDIPRAIREAPDLGISYSTTYLPQVFGPDPSVQAEASPINYVSSDKRYPPFLLIYVGVFDTSPQGSIPQTLSKVQSEIFAETLTAAGGYARVYGEADRTHSSIIRQFAMPGDGITAETKAFLAQFTQPSHN